MTCVVALEHKGEVYFGCDSTGVKDDQVLAKIPRNDEKIFKNGPFLIGFTSSFRMGQILRYSLKIPRQGRKQVMTYLVNDLMDTVRSTFKKKGFSSKKSEDDSSDYGGEFLLGYKGRVYSIGSDYQVGINTNGYAAVGCGEPIAMGSFHSTKDVRDPVKRCRMALEAAATFSAGVEGPFKFMSTASKGYL